MSNRVQTSNPFDLLGDDLPKPVAAAPKPAAPKPAATKPAATTAKSAATSAKPAASQKDQSKGSVQKSGEQKGNQSQRPPKPQGGQAKRSPAQGRPATEGDDSALTEKDKSSRPRRDRNDRGQGRPGRGRAFDRKSGTGRPANESKRDDAGKNNWGTEIDAQTEALKPETTEGEENPTVSAEGADAAAEAPKVEEKETLGLEEYLAKLKEKAPKDVASLKPREVDASDLANAGFAPLKRDDTESSLKKKEKAPKKAVVEVPKTDAAAAKEKTISADQLINFAAPQRQDDRRGGRGGRGGRGDSRGGRGRGDRRPSGDNKPKGSPKQSEFKISESSFPSLGGSGGVQAPAGTKA